MISSSTLDETVSQISQMRDSISESLKNSISRTKSFEMLNSEATEKSSPARVRPKSLFCSTSTPVRSVESIPEIEGSEIGESLIPNPDSPGSETDPTLKAVKKAMARSDFLQRLDK